jgi:hypothetical protein
MALSALLSANWGARSLSKNYRWYLAEIRNRKASGKNVDVLEVPLPVQKKSNPITGLERPIGFQEVEATRYQDDRHMKVVRLFRK